MDKAASRAELYTAFGFGLVALAALFAVAIFTQNQNPLLITLARVTLALACAGVAAVIPGFLHLQIQPTVSNVIRAGGALAVFVLVFFFNPPGLIQEDTPPPPPPISDYMPVVDQWIKKIDAKRYMDAYESAGSDTRREYAPEFFVSLYQSHLHPLGAVVGRKLRGANSATMLPTGEKGTFRLVAYETEFATGRKQIEQVIVKAESGEWKIRNHTFYPMPKE